MLKWARSIDWLSIGASALILCAVLVFHPEIPGHSQQYAAPEQESCEIVAPSSTDERLADYTLGLEVFTGILALFTVVLAGASIWQGILTGRAVNLARDEFNATHRPQIAIHSAKFEQIPDEGGDSALDTLAATIVYYNTGSSPAFVQDIRYSISPRTLPLPSGIFPNVQIAPKNGTLESGLGDFMDLRSDIDLRTTRLITDETSKIVLIGKIFYRDGAGGLRQTGFCRVLDLQGPAWVHANPREFEYEYGY